MCVCVVCEFFLTSTAYVISKFNSKNDITHCMPHLQTHPTLYSMRRLVVPCGYESLRGSDLADVSFYKYCQCQHIEQNKCIDCKAKQSFHEPATLCSQKIYMYIYIILLFDIKGKSR